MREHLAHQLLGDFGKDRSRKNRRIERDRARYRTKVGKPDAHRHGPTRPGFGTQAARDPIGKMTQRGPENLLLCRLPAERRLGSRRLRPSMRRDLAGIAIPRERIKLLRRCGTEQPR